ncbi:MAG TPA: ECF-type sigma factor [Bryobacteraceae bacterium]
MEEQNQDLAGSLLDEELPRLYAELRDLARAYLRRERSDHTLQPTALVHEAYLRLRGQKEIDWRNRAQFLAIAAQTMRRVLLDHAGQRRAQKRGAGAKRVSLTDSVGLTQAAQVDFIDIDNALTTLGDWDRRQARIIELRFFGGLTAEEVAEVLEVSPATVNREWATARLWLMRRLQETQA